MSMPSAATAGLVNLPNVLTAIRLLCVPVLIVLLTMPPGPSGIPRNLAALVFVMASVTDILDGIIARRRGQVTTFGKLADPIADKALTGTVLIGLSVLGLLAWWVTVVILIREVGVTVLRLWVIRQRVIPASRGGKAKTVVQAIAITMYLIVIPAGLLGPELASAWDLLRTTVMGAAVVLTVVTGVDYVIQAVRLRAPVGAGPST